MAVEDSSAPLGGPPISPRSLETLRCVSVASQHMGRGRPHPSTNPSPYLRLAPIKCCNYNQAGASDGGGGLERPWAEAGRQVGRRAAGGAAVRQKQGWSKGLDQCRMCSGLFDAAEKEICMCVTPFDRMNEPSSCREPGEGGADELDEEENAPMSAASLMMGEEHAMAGTVTAGGGSAGVAASEEVLPEVRYDRGDGRVN